LKAKGNLNASINRTRDHKDTPPFGWNIGCIRRGGLKRNTNQETPKPPKRPPLFRGSEGEKKFFENRIKKGIGESA